MTPAIDVAEYHSRLVHTENSKYCDFLTVDQYETLRSLWSHNELLVLDYLGIVQEKLRQRHGILTTKDGNFMMGDLGLVSIYDGTSPRGSKRYTTLHHRPQNTYLIPLTLGGQKMDIAFPIGIKGDNLVLDYSQFPLKEIKKIYNDGYSMIVHGSETIRVTLFQYAEFILLDTKTPSK